LRAYAKEAQYEFLKLWRMPAYVVPTTTFPLLFYVMFGVLFGGRQNVSSVTVSTYLLATYGAFGVMAASLFGFGVGVAMERGYGWLQVKRASPMPPLAYLFAKMVMSMIFSMIVITGLFLIGKFLAGVQLPLTSMLGLAGILVAGAIPFCALGLALGCLASPNAAPAVVNMIYLPMAFCSGLWIPLPFLPRFLQQVAHFLPSYHLSQLALRMTGAVNTGDPLTHVAALAIFTIIFLLIAWRAFRRDDVKIHG
jgi:ABC-2 type transport system permease protein